MRRAQLLMCVILLCWFPAISFAGDRKGEDYKKQMSQIELFYKILQKKAPKISDFYLLFGRDNEAELESILRQEFPTLSMEEWDLNKKAVNYVDKVLSRPALHVSRFLRCLKMKEPELFASKSVYRIQTPPEVTKDFRRFTVRIDNDHERNIVFEFSQTEPYIESIILPDGRSVYTLIDSCRK